LAVELEALQRTYPAQSSIALELAWGLRHRIVLYATLHQEAETKVLTARFLELLDAWPELRKQDPVLDRLAEELLGVLRIHRFGTSE
jgi:hypothetical protein